MAIREKGDDEDRLFGIDWTADLDGDVITGSTWNVPEGLVGTFASFDDRKTAVRLSGGVAGVVYDIQNVITTLARGETLEATIRIEVVANRYVD